MGNIGYNSVKQLRKSNINAELLMEKKPIYTADPIALDPTLNGIYPEWMHHVDMSKQSWKFKIIKEMRKKKYDLIHAHVEYGMFANFCGKPFIAHAHGTELRIVAHTNSIRGILQRMAYKKAKVVLYVSADLYNSVNKLNLKNAIFLPTGLDTSFYHKKDSSITPQDDLVIFLPTSLDWIVKGTDKLILGYKKFIEKHPNSVLIMINFGADAQKTTSLIKKYHLENKVKIIKKFLDKQELLEYYNHADIIVDQFNLGGLSLISFETFACGKPLIAFIHKDLHRIAYGDLPPMAIAQTSDEIAEHLELLCDKKLRNEMGQNARQWVLNHHSYESFTKKMIYIYNSVLQDVPVDEIRTHTFKLK